MSRSTRNGDVPAADVSVDPNAVIEALTQQIARLTLELAIRDAAIVALRAPTPEPAEQAAAP